MHGSSIDKFTPCFLNAASLRNLSLLWIGLCSGMPVMQKRKPIARKDELRGELVDKLTHKVYHQRTIAVRGCLNASETQLNQEFATCCVDTIDQRHLSACAYPG